MLETQRRKNEVGSPQPILCSLYLTTAMLPPSMIFTVINGPPIFGARVMFFKALSKHFFNAKAP